LAAYVSGVVAVGHVPRLKRAYYSASIAAFLSHSDEEVLGHLLAASEFAVDPTQNAAWQGELKALREALPPFASQGQVYLEFVVPRVGKRIDVVVVIADTVFVIEFKVGEQSFGRGDVEQVWDYAVDLKNFHESSHAERIAPILVVTGATGKRQLGDSTVHHDGVLGPSLISADQLHDTLVQLLGSTAREAINASAWDQGRYRPTPTIVEAASALYRGHSVVDISRSDAGATNLTTTSAAVARVIESSRAERRKSICLVTGVPGAGKTLVGLDVATRYLDPHNDLHSVFLSGNGPLVAILREALARDDVQQAKDRGQKKSKGEARQAVKTFIQPVHHFRDECIKDSAPPHEHVTIFDESQRAWNREKTADFMKRKKGLAGFAMSEPEFLISCLDRHQDWAVIVCLVGGGQEINTGEAGISEWISAIQSSYPHWHVHVSPQLSDSEYAAESALQSLQQRSHVYFDEALHLSVSMRSFRAETLSAFVKTVLDLDATHAAKLHAAFADRYPIMLTRDLRRARTWLRQRARGSERYGIVVSSQAQRLKPHAIDVRTPVDPVNWFLADKEDVRSSFYLEDVATEFQVQGLELDWTCVVWDADFRHGKTGWQHHSFIGTKWNQIHKGERKAYLKNAYRVLLTRARQGMVIVVPEGEPQDQTRRPEFYDGTFEFLKSAGLPVL
jgi:Uncharacterized conserved protein (DUF2075)